MGLSNSERSSLRARANRLKCTINVGREGVSEPIVRMIRLAFGKNDLIKIRIHSESTGEADTIAKDLAAAVPCELVGRTGFVAVLHKTSEAQVDG